MGLLHFSNLLRFGGQYCLKLARLRFLCPVMDWEPLSRRLCLLTCLYGALATLARLWLSAARPACFSASLHLSQHCSLCPVVSCCVPQLLLAPSLVRFPPLVTAAGWALQPIISVVSDPMTPRNAACQVSLSFTMSWSLLQYSNEYSGLISFRIDRFDLLAVQETIKSFLQHHGLKASVLWCSAFFMVQFSHLYMTTGTTVALTIWTFVGKVMSLLFNTLSSHFSRHV